MGQQEAGGVMPVFERVKRMLRQGEAPGVIAGAVGLARRDVESVRSGHMGAVVGERRDWPRGPLNTWWGQEVGALPFGVMPADSSVVRRAWDAGLAAAARFHAGPTDDADDFVERSWAALELYRELEANLRRAHGLGAAQLRYGDAAAGFLAAFHAERARLAYVRRLAERVAQVVEEIRQAEGQDPTLLPGSIVSAIEAVLVSEVHA